MEDAVYTVAIVVAPEYGDRVGALAARMPVWIADTPSNRAAAERLWRQYAARRARADVTTFVVDPDESPEQWCAGVIAAVDLHHGEWSHDPPYGAVEVHGATPNDAVRAALAEYGLTQITRELEGFRASKPDGAV